MTTTSRNTCFVLLATTLVASSAWAQSDSKPLNLNLPPISTLPATSTGTSSAKPASTAPGMYYGDTSGTTVAGTTASNPNAAADTCDDAAYNKPQVHGSVGMGVVAGNHVSGNYQTGTVNIHKAFGSCNHSGGGLNITISDSQGHFDYPRRGR